MGKKLTAKYADPRAGDVRYSKADISRTRADVGYDPTVTFEEGLAKTLAWYRGQNWN
jgi:UDP-glucose 4-epimerase